ncbi:MAG: phage antirepressor KilAC domain-containing protein [Bacteroidaceae bacterium]|nr:phage antirepressor KilAC domain-containing protein [Bacteroidaceae bacterium]
MEIKVFQNAAFGTIRTMQDEKGEPLFCAKDVAEALGYKNTRDALHKHVERDDVAKRDTIDSMGRTQLVTFINESGLYALILSSKLPKAREFKHWVTGEVLPAIRRQGGYMVARADESEEVILARALQIMHATLQRKEEQIARLQPRAEYADRVLDSVSCFTTTQLAKGMGMTAQELNRLLCLHGIQYGQSGQYMLYAPYARQGLATNRIHSYHDMFGAVHTTSSLVWTERGREFVYQLFNN